MKKNNIALIVHACDRYELLFKGFEYFFSKNWDFDIPVNYYFATEEVSAGLANFKNIKSGKGEWSNRLSTLFDQIEEDYILYFQEDMWLNKPVDKEVFTELFKQTLANQWNLVKLNSSEVFKTNSTPLFIKGFNVSVLDNKESNFLMSHQVSLWNKAFFKQQLKPNEHPWRNERKGTKRLKELNPEIFHLDYFAENGNPAINKNTPDIVRSEYQSISMNATLNHNAAPFLEELKSAPHLAAYTEKLIYNFENGITHDGKPKPLKKDLFKKIKDWVKGKK
ncbi:hypothetical protein HDF26_004479 [Pedobacter cryoconitis]|uniref:hypothetical protein n=1 Tax=Pedobacter cryoconitis TaxID=188932 RepID=UPI0016204E5F|nr:hypothetical protein [Pedobacter cryoconitis]MBB6274006.1 hypothetical protein [Pedobacter cryoconitis]